MVIPCLRLFLFLEFIEISPQVYLYAIEIVPTRYRGQAGGIGKGELSAFSLHNFHALFT